ncbi:hypothetical protein SLS64_012361 [Diaporthe eres]|uniref:Uncharacterized protein n=1 Tax=Diaporthe eres TaxID=83184 RepID=A0ABR1P0L1_DIAER
MAGSDQRAQYDVREKIGMIGSIPPPPRDDTKIKVLHEIMGVLSDKMKTLSKEEAVQAEKRVVLDEKMDILSKMLDVMS